jgi:hypothetical protein
MIMRAQQPGSMPQPPGPPRMPVPAGRDPDEHAPVEEPPSPAPPPIPHDPNPEPPPVRTRLSAPRGHGRAYLGTTLGWPLPGAPGGGMTGIVSPPALGAPLSISASPAAAGGAMTPPRALPPGVSAPAPGGSGAGAAV